MDVIMDGRQEMTVNGRIVRVGRLSLTQVTKCATLISNVMSDVLPSLQAAQKDNAAMMTILGALGPKADIMLAVLLDTDDLEYVRGISAEDATDVIAVVCEKNDFGRILGNVLRAMGTLQKAILKPPSPASPA